MIDNKLKSALLSIQKPARYTGGEPGCIIKDKKDIDIRFAFCFPDTYEVGMSHLGLKVIYDALNKQPNIWCERCFAPWLDMIEQMKKREIPLFALESKDPLKEFDIVGFTLQYELSYTNVLLMLELAGIPFYAKDRDESWPLICAGGPCTCNAEPMADFFDFMFLGEGEFHTVEVCNKLNELRKVGKSKKEILIELSKIDGIYVPSLYQMEYNEDNTIKSVSSDVNAPIPCTKAIVRDFKNYPFPTDVAVPMIGAIHDRAMVEVLRGCVRGCRFCQAGFIYRPFRERDADLINEGAKELCRCTGYEEVSLTSLSTSDHPQLEELLDKMMVWTEKEKVNIALPSLRVDNFSESLVEKVSKVRKSGLTFAPEAGTQRLRDIINKNVTEEEIEKTCKLAFKAGYSAVKLYFMMGLPGETMEDIKGIADTAKKVIEYYYSMPDRPKGRGAEVSISVACFVPKPFTPFQWHGQDTTETVREKQRHMVKKLKNGNIKYNYHDSKTSLMEAVIARGDRKIGKVIYDAFKNGAKFDGWAEHFKLEIWEEAMANNGLDIAFYANRERSYEEVFPWDHIEVGVTKKFLIRENEKAKQDTITVDCRHKCSGCGISAHTIGKGLC